ncbi:MAG: GIY-YIG nuclease family protein [Ruminococcaceae bacterium]|nr:GIY-YIG nuclease family protein [Oscillospiraceae bacterium]
MVGIYKFTNVIDGKSYIGKSKNITRRYNHHKRLAGGEADGFNLYVDSVMREVGFHNFEFMVLEECHPEELDEKEKYYIKKFNTLIPNGYNISFGGRGGRFQSIKSFEEIKEIQRLLSDTVLSEAEIGRKFGVTDVTISYINVGKIWKNENVSYPIRTLSLNRIITPVHCERCGKAIHKRNKFHLCQSCYSKKKGEHIPPKELLFEELMGSSFEAVGRKYGVTGNAVKKWCEKYGLPNHAYEYRKLRDLRDKH